MEHLTFGEIIKKERVRRNLPLRKVSAQLDIDQSLLSKIENGKRDASQKQIKKLSEIFALDEKLLFAHYISEKIARELFSHDDYYSVLNLLETKIRMLRSRMTEQGSISFNDN